MIVQVTDSIWLDDSDVCTAEQLAEVSGLSSGEISDLIENNVITPVDRDAEPQTFRLHYMLTARTARRLRDDFELDRQGVALALTLLNQIDDLESELQAARVRLIHAIEGHAIEGRGPT
jgi:chaperone modulatory protein CbpM